MTYSPAPRRWPLLVAVLTLAAFALRLIALGRDSLWYDETVSVSLAGQPVRELIAHTARDIHPPLYYLLLRGWLLLSGYPTGHADATGHGLEFMAAWLSLAFGVLLVPLTWQLARRLGVGHAAATVAAGLAALSPFGVWYSQEVRMYTLGASLGVVCLLATLPFLQHAGPRRLRWAAPLYALAAAAGMYTLYYFAFLLVSLNLLVLARMTTPLLRARQSLDRAPMQSTRAWQPIAMWLAAQAAAALLYLPWLPVAWRQATDPPVPPWRTAPNALAALWESLSALSFGQSAEPARIWPLLLAALALVMLGLGRGRASRTARSLLVTASLGPLLLILVASAATPLYHVRYVFTYSPAWSVLVALGLEALGRGRGRVRLTLLAGASAALLVGSLLSLRAFWTSPAYASDDLRGAVRELAQRWRPGDLLLINAGYTYPALLTYWPLPVIWRGRLSAYTPALSDMADAGDGAVILESGHIDGPAGLGWDDPRSDFYALPRSRMQEVMRQLTARTARLWHLRLYDTVSDPAGALRAALDQGWTLFDDRVYRGEASLRVQGWYGMRLALTSYRPPVVGVFDRWLELALPPHALPAVVEAGAVWDVRHAQWSLVPGHDARAVAVSLRLVDAADTVWAAVDEPLGGNVQDPATQREWMQPLRLIVPEGTPPGRYRATLVVYDPQNGAALPVTVSDDRSTATEVTLSEVEVVRPAHSLQMRRALADFGPLRLVQANTPATRLSPGDDIPLDLSWQAAPTYQPTALVVVVQLLDAGGRVVASLEAEPLDGRYPTAQWQPGELVRDRHRLTAPPDLASGRYRLIVGLYRAEDRQRLDAHRGPAGWRRSIAVEVTSVEIASGAQ